MPEKMGIEGKIILHLDEYEAVRLSDYLRLSHSEAAERMGVSRSTFTRLIGGAHRKIGEAITLGKEIFIRGGNVRFQRDILRCKACGNTIPFVFGDSSLKDCPQCGRGRLHSIGRQFQRRGRYGNKGKGGFGAGNEE